MNNVVDTDKNMYIDSLKPSGNLRVKNANMQHTNKIARLNTKGVISIGIGRSQYSSTYSSVKTGIWSVGLEGTYPDTVLGEPSADSVNGSIVRSLSTTAGPNDNNNWNKIYNQLMI